MIYIYHVLCHTHDLPAAVKSDVRLFADECLLYRQIRSVQAAHMQAAHMQAATRPIQTGEMVKNMGYEI
jgi:hypothetical protein